MKTRIRGLVAAVAIMMAAGASSVIAQEPAKPAVTPPATQGPTFRSGVDLITVDVGVVDGRGNPVEDLGAAEFSVKVDGEVRRVVSAELVKVDVEAAKKTVADKNETFYTATSRRPTGARSSSRSIRCTSAPDRSARSWQRPNGSSTSSVRWIRSPSSSSP